MGIYRIKPSFQKLLQPATNFFIRYRIHPTYLNLLGLLASILIGIIFFVAIHNLTLLWLIPPLAFIRTALNALDGQVARGLQISNQAFGEVLNETLDRISDSVIFMGLAFSNIANSQLVWITLTLILITSYLSIVSKAAGGKRQYGGLMGKADRMLAISLLAITITLTSNIDLANLFIGFILIGIIQTFIIRFIATRESLSHGHR